MFFVVIEFFAKLRVFRTQKGNQIALQTTNYIMSIMGSQIEGREGMAKPTSVEQHKLVTSFETVRRTLLNGKQDQRLEKPLAYWALPNDRRLPLALLDQSLKDILARPYEELSSTRGIGRKKMGAMIKLLLRAANDNEHEVPYGIEELAAGDDDLEGGLTTANGFDASTVSEPQWSQWKSTIARHGLQAEMLGRLAPALEHLPTVIWQRPLGFYLEYSLAEIRRLKTHGEKRVTVLLEVFRDIDHLLASVPAGGHIALRLLPRFAQKMEYWVAAALSTEELPDVEAVRKHVAAPLLRQVKLDLGETIHKLCEGRIGIRSKPQSVKAQSRRLGVTRARVYQLLDECGAAFAVRWPEGRWQLAALSQRFASEQPDADAQEMLDAARRLFFPEKLEAEEE